MARVLILYGFISSCIPGRFAAIVHKMTVVEIKSAVIKSGGVIMLGRDTNCRNYYFRHSDIEAVSISTNVFC